LPLEVKGPLGFWLPPALAVSLGVAPSGVAWACNRGHLSFLHLPATNFLQTSLVAVELDFVDVPPVDVVSKFGAGFEIRVGTGASFRLWGGVSAFVDGAVVAV
jgi:hypothetical protein